MKQKLLIPLSLILALISLSSWGFFAHRRINHLAVFTLPPEMLGFYKSNIGYITEHAVDPDKRRYIDSSEAAHHYLDADHYGTSPFDSIPVKWKDAVAKYGADTLNAYGTLPWQIERTYFVLVKAFEEHDLVRILRYSSWLGHYVADANVPLHTTENYDGQLSGQEGIHAFWESRLPELFSDDYDFFTGRARYIESALQEAWKIIKHTHAYTDTVFRAEKNLDKQFPEDRKYSFSKRNGIVIKQYSEEYSRAYQKTLKGMVERQMRSSVYETGCLWYSAWVDAGQPDLDKIKKGGL